MAVSKRLRYEILRRDSNTCRYCGRSAPEVKLAVDHVTPTALGGSDDPTNLVASCVDCNAGKSASSPDAALVADVDQKAVVWAQAMEVAIERRAVELGAERKRTNRFNRKWLAYRTYDATYPRDHNWRNSIGRFMAGGLDDQFLADAVETAMGKPRIPAEDVWRYFCGICWRELDTIRDMTAAAVSAAQPVAPVDPDSDEAELAEGFPFMEMFSTFLDDALAAAHVGEQARKIAHSSLWSSMSIADRIWRTRSLSDPEWDASFAEAWLADEDNEGTLPSRYAMACEGFSATTAYDMYQITLAVRTAEPDQMAGVAWPSPS